MATQEMESTLYDASRVDDALEALVNVTESFGDDVASGVFDNDDAKRFVNDVYELRREWEHVYDLLKMSSEGDL